jgi:ATP synthase protein I
MFTSVDSNRKKIVEHLPGKNVHDSPAQGNSFINKIKFVFASQFQKLFLKNDEYTKLQITIFGITFIVAILVASITGIIIGYTFGFSVFIGAIAGIFYLRLLAKSIGKIGKESNGVSQLQLLVPVCLFLFASKLGSLDIFPAMIGFFIYKPSLIFYFSRS